MRSSLRIGFFVDALDRNFQSQVLSGIVDASKNSNTHLLIYSGALQVQPNERESQYNIVRDFIIRNSLDGLIVLTGAITAHYSLSKTIDLFNSFNNLPVVSIATAIEGATNILIDNTGGIKTLMNHLINDHGFSRISFVKGPARHQESELRFQAFCSSLEEYRLPLKEEYIYQGSDFCEEAGEEAIEWMIENCPILPQAIVAADDTIAIGIIQGLKRNGLSVPDDIAVVGFDDQESASFTTPPLTTVGQPFYNQGKKAVEALLEEIRHGSRVEDILLDARQIIRNSCGCTRSIQQCGEMSAEYMGNLGIGEFFDCQFKSLWRFGEEELPQIRQLLVKMANRFKEANEKNRDSWFLVWFEVILQSIFVGEKAGYYWKYTLDCFFSYINKKYLYNNEDFFVERLYRRTRELTEEQFLIQRQKRRLREDDQKYKLHVLSHLLISTLDQKEMVDLMLDKMTSLNIRTCFLALYSQCEGRILEDEWFFPKQSDLVMAYKDGENLLKNEQQYRFSTASLLPEEFLNMDQCFSWVFLPVSFKNEHYGYILFDHNSETIISLYETLRIFIGNAIRNSRLMKKLSYDAINKTNFFINIAHEMKTPLTIIKSYLEKYISNPDDPEDLEITLDNVKKLERDMINFLDVEKLQRGRLTYDHSQVHNISALLKRKMIDFKAICKNRGLSIKVHIELNLFMAMDLYALDRIFNNLLDNAIRYNIESGWIEVSLKSVDPDTIGLIIRNSCISMDKEERMVVFEPFTQLGNTKRNIQGIGVGLSIIKGIIVDFGGTVQVLDEDKRIFCISIVLPNKVRDQQFHWQEETDHTEKLVMPKTLSIDQPVHSQERATVLIVEDNRELIALLQKMLSKEFNVYFGLDGKMAVKILSRIPKPDIIISDIMMDGIDGYALLEILQQSQSWNDIPFLFITARSSQDERIRGIQAGAVDFIAKPFSIAELSSKIKTMLHLKELQKNTILSEISRNFDQMIARQQKCIDADPLSVPLSKSELKTLSLKETQVYDRLVDGKYYKEIADELNISINTVKTYVKRVYQKFGVSSRNELMKVDN